MVEASLAELVERGFAREVRGDAAVRVRGVRHDSRFAAPGDLFVALVGEKQYGADFAPEAIARGAVAVLADRPLSLPVPVAVTDDVLRSLSAIAQHVYGDPTTQLATVGITGTNGKTTTSYLVEATLRAAGREPAVLGTVNFRGPAGVRAASHTTPMADDLMRLARWAVDTGATHLVLEVSSHALAMQRADGVHFAVAAFTNITHDHLDYHGDFESYARAKRRLFEALAPAVSVLNIDDALGLALTKSAHGRILRCSRRADTSAEIRVLSQRFDRHGIAARVATPAGQVELESPLVGEHNLENCLIALGCGLGLGLSLDAIVAGIASSRGAPGRLERVDHDELTVFVDYAHTPDALERVLRALRPSTSGRLFVVFGCGGDRDRRKRPTMGRAAIELADVAIATSDNPRSEPPQQILEQIELGMRAAGGVPLEAKALPAAERGYFVCADRRAAIELALLSARAGDCVLIAGKGHEKLQIVGDQKLPFDDCAEAARALAKREARG